MLKAACLFGVALVLSSCGTLNLNKSETSLTPEERVLLMCEGWQNIFRRVDIRDQVGVATKAEISAINNARYVMNSTCTNYATPKGLSLEDLELTLARLIALSRSEAD